MKLFIRADANGQIGAGHLMRCLALAQAWKKQCGRVTFISACESKSLKNRITDEGFELVPIENPYPDADDLVTTLSIINNQSSTNDWIVLDGYHFDTDYKQSIKNICNPLLVIDDTAHLKHYVADIILNQNINAEGLSYSCEPDTELLLGTDYVLLRDEFLAWQDWQREIREVAKKVLVTMGSGDPDNVTLRVLKALNLMNDSSLEVKIIIGPANPNIESLKEELTLSSFRFDIITFAQNMPELMAWGDLAISGGGSTCWELVFMKLPSLIIILAENQEMIAAGLQKEGTAINCGWFHELTVQHLVQCLDTLINDKDSRFLISQRCGELIDSYGPKRVINEMVSIA